jgi:two-component system response regulator AtoC
MSAAVAMAPVTNAFPPQEAIFGATHEMRVVKDRLMKVAPSQVPVLIAGESGTGKDVIANLVHQHSPRRNGKFVRLNCPAIPATLIESELFGYEEGAFTGAITSKAGLVEAADSGTLFFDEVAEMPLELQSKLLHFIQDGSYSRIGSNEMKRSNARLVFSTHRDLQAEVRKGAFREDLLFRINVVSLKLPALRERKDDIPTLARMFVDHYSALYQTNVPKLSSTSMEKLLAFHWPGNIRQLENFMKRYAILCSEESLFADFEEAPPQDMLKFDFDPMDPVPLKDLTRQAVGQLERRIILKVLNANHWNRRKTADMLQISYRALLYKIRDNGIRPGQPRGGKGVRSAEVEAN